MSKHNHHITSLKVFFNYIKNKLSYGDRYSFEKRMMHDAFEADAHEGFMQFDEETIKSDLKHLKYKIVQRKENRFVYWKIAASVLLIVSVSVVLFQLRFEDETLISDNIIKEEVVEKDALPAPSPDSVELDKTIVAVEDKEEEKASIHPLVKKLKATPLAKVSSKKKSAKKQVYHQERSNEAVDDVSNEVAGLARNESIIAAQESDAIQEIGEVEVVANVPEAKTMMVSSVALASSPEERKGKRAKKTKKDTNSIMIKGKVVDDLGMPLPGVTVIVKGTNQGTITDMEGNYALNATDRSAMLEYAFIGYKSYEVKAQKAADEIQLEPEMTALQDVVVVGYGATQKEELSMTTSARPLMGYSAYRKYIAEQLVHPEPEIEEKQVVVFKLKISSSGEIINFEIVKSPDKEYTQEAIRVLKASPKWIPAMNNGTYLESEVRFRVVFKQQ